MGPVYHIPCNWCETSYIGEKKDIVKSTVWEVSRRPSPTNSEVSRHIHNPEHQVDMDGVKILAVELR